MVSIDDRARFSFVFGGGALLGLKDGPPRSAALSCPGVSDDRFGDDLIIKLLAAAMLVIPAKADSEATKALAIPLPETQSCPRKRVLGVFYRRRHAAIR